MSKKTYMDYQEGTITALISNPSELSKVLEVLTPNDFSNENYRMMFRSMSNLYHNDEPVTLPSILRKMIQENPEAHIDPEWVLSLDSNGAKWSLEAPASVWADLLKIEAAKHYTNRLLQESIKRVDQEDPVTLLAEMTEVANQIAFNASRSVESTVEDDVMGYLEHMDARLDTKKHIIPTPYPSINKYITGLLPGQLITIGARPSIGKSVVATQTAVTACSAGKSTAIFSLEMGKYEVMDRILSSMSMIEMRALKGRKLSTDEREQFSEALEQYKQFKLHIDDTPSVGVEYIKQKALSLAQSENGLDLIIIDYLQLMQTNKNTRNREQAVAELSREMKNLAKLLQIPIMILVQVNREKADQEDTIPKLSDIRESGAIAADSDVVILLHRRLDSDEIDPKVMFILAKNRNGEPGKKLFLRCQLEYAMFLDTSENIDYSNTIDLEEYNKAILEENNTHEIFSETPPVQQAEPEFVPPVNQGTPDFNVSPTSNPSDLFTQTDNVYGNPLFDNQETFSYDDYEEGDF